MPRISVDQDHNYKKASAIHPDQRYIVALRHNDVRLIKEIYELNAVMIKNLICSNNGTAHDAKDVMQEVLICMHRYANNDFVLTCSLKSFLYTLCKRKWISMLKAKSKSQTLRIATIHDLSYAVEAKESMNAWSVIEDRLCFSKRLFNCLGPSCKEILSMSWTKNDAGKFTSLKTVAEELSLSYSYVRKKAVLCKARLVELAKKDPNYKLL